MKHIILIVLLPFFIASCSHTKEWGTDAVHNGNKKTQLNKLLAAKKFYAKGVASYYGNYFKGRPTATGQIFDPGLLTAASKTIPFNSTVLVRDTETGNFVIVVVNDAGPYVGDRILDLSEGAAEKLGILKKGLAMVEIYTLPAAADTKIVPRRIKSPS